MSNIQVSVFGRGCDEKSYYVFCYGSTAHFESQFLMDGKINQNKQNSSNLLKTAN